MCVSIFLCCVVLSCVGRGLVTGRPLPLPPLGSKEESSKSWPKNCPERPRLRVGYSAYVLQVFNGSVSSSEYVALNDKAINE
jgi:hypothetical protein